MAHQIQPSHRPHEQLRTEPPAQRVHTDKYVSAFVSGEADVDMSFRNPILTKSADHFKVGIDELTVNLGNLSMLEYGTNGVLFRILRRGNNNEASDFRMIDGTGTTPASYWRDAFEFKIDRAFLTMHEILARCEEVATAVGTFIREEGLVAGPGNWTLEYAAGQGNDEHFRISITANGQLRFSGNKVFWANFTVEVPELKYRQILFKDDTLQYISMHPGTGNQIAVPYGDFQALYEAAVIARAALPDEDAGIPAADALVAQYEANILAGLLRGKNLDPAWNNNLGNVQNVGSMEYVASGNMLNTLDRRVTLEVGCSLPLKNSPLVDHGVEAPDFVLGRFMLHQPYTMGLGPDITVSHLGTVSVQGPRDRVVFHHLQPQQKIQTLRLKLWARVRTYNTVTRKWGMKTIVCPVEGTDYWHIRLHFVEKG